MVKWGIALLVLIIACIVFKFFLSKVMVTRKNVNTRLREFSLAENVYWGVLADDLHYRKDDDFSELVFDIFSKRDVEYLDAY